MTLTTRGKKIVVLGLMSKMPFAGVVWQTLHYLLGFKRLGFDVYYVEAHGISPKNFIDHESDDGVTRAAAYINSVLGSFDLGDRWSYHAPHDGNRYLGMSEAQVSRLYAEADLIINLHGGTIPLPEHSATGRLIYVETDPVEVQIQLHAQRADTIAYLEPHAAFFTFGENYGRPDCLLPVSDRFRFQPTRQPVVLDFWKTASAGGDRFTTVGNWKQAGRDLRFRSDVYHWSKHHEFLKFLDLPSRTGNAFELALSSVDEDDRQLLERHGWRVIEGLGISRHPDPYRSYVTGSRGEFTVAKDQNVRLRTGWFSDRSATYLAAGRPVITQDTGFGSILPTGEGLFAFETMDDILAAIDRVNGDYERQSRSAVEIARDYFGHDVVLTRLLGDVGLAPSSRRESKRVPTLEKGIPRSTVVIPAFNNAALTKTCLEAVLCIGGCEVIVVDDASTDETPHLLRSFSDTIHVITHAKNRGFAQTCNDGAAAARTEFVVFLNSDTIPRPGWLTALEEYAGQHARATVIGGKLLYPDSTIQHAGVVICQDRYPRHIYSGFPADHPSVNTSRRFQVVTAACMLVRREAFDAVGGFDVAFRNGFEDVDLCLRLGERGHEVHYCAESVVQHLESVAPGRFHHDRDNVALYRHRWLGRVHADDLRYYAEDGLLNISYEGSYPVHLDVSPLLAQPSGDGRRDESARLLAERTRQVSDLRRENTRLQVELGARGTQSPGLRYDDLRRSIRDTVQSVTPAGAVVLIVSKGDGLLLDVPDREGWHFPRTERGTYAGHHPASSIDAIDHLEALRAKGAEYLVFPSTASWWLDHYAEFRQHLESRYRLVARHESTCQVFALQLQSEEPQRPPSPQPSDRSRPAVSGTAASVSSKGTPRVGPRKKVLFVCHNHPMVMPGGAEVYALELYEAMRDSDQFEPIFLARVASPVPNSHSVYPGSAISALNCDPNQYVFHTKTSDFDVVRMVSRNTDGCTKDFGQFLLDHRPDVVHFQHTLFLGYDFIKQIPKTLPDAAIVYTLHEYLPICHRNGQMVRTQTNALCGESSPQRCHECFPDISPITFAERKQNIQSYFSLVDVFIAPSLFLLERYVEWGVPREKIRYEEYGRRTICPLTALSSDRARNRFGFFGQLNPFKGVDVLLKAMQILSTARPGAQADSPHLWIHGANLERQRGDFQADFGALLEASGPNVTFVGPYDRAGLAILMANIDWVIVPSIWWENSPLVIQEAFGHDRPVICSDIGGMAEKVRDRVDGLHFHVGDPAHLAETMLRAATTPGLWTQLVEGVSAVYSVEEHTGVLSGLYDSILEVRALRAFPKAPAIAE